MDPWTTPPATPPTRGVGSSRDFLKENWLWVALVTIALVPVLIMAAYLAYSAVDMALTDCSAPAPEDATYCTS